MALDRIVHPHLLVALRERIFTARRVMNRAVLDAALIVEWGARREMDCLVLVTAPEEVRLRRLMERDGLSMDEASRRIRSQIPEDDKRPFADFEITNTGTPEQLLEKADAVWQAIEKACTTGDFQPKQGPLCSYCSFRDWCPAFGGSPDRARDEAPARYAALTT